VEAWLLPRGLEAERPLAEMGYPIAAAPPLEAMGVPIAFSTNPDLSNQLTLLGSLFR